ncbi:hypothetical protein VNO78_25028 [Psophocarpus tetragonolobus]|uniref:Uncharacterized protein n=1 Tax=Psophocarpus tetragonolobus TaxID=3891 RepID=A0AAN9S5P4_PSOTE
MNDFELENYLICKLNSTLIRIACMIAKNKFRIIGPQYDNFIVHTCHYVLSAFPVTMANSGPVAHTWLSYARCISFTLADVVYTCHDQYNIMTFIHFF